jgi:hypothetical protein
MSLIRQVISGHILLSKNQTFAVKEEWSIIADKE